MKVVFAGPSLGDARLDIPGVELRGPAGMGDLAAAVLDGATAIGLIDGVFETVAATWHKEILFALWEGVRVSGAASMGALRAAECAAFGMVGIGSVYARYADDGLTDDAAVAQLHAPAELGYFPLSEPLVNMEATFARLATLAIAPGEETDRLLVSARRVFFKERTYARVVAEAGFVAARAEALLALIGTHRQDVKRDDALELVDYVKDLPSTRLPHPTAWRFEESNMWRKFIAGLLRQRPTRTTALAGRPAAATAEAATAPPAP